MGQLPPIVGYIYLVTNLVNGKKYVGLTKLIPKRWGEPDPAYLEKNRAVLPKAWAAHSAKATARDAQLPLEEQARRARRRERDRVNAKRRYDMREAEPS
jgi:hypothetical protein